MISDQPAWPQIHARHMQTVGLREPGEKEITLVPINVAGHIGSKGKFLQGGTLRDSSLLDGGSCPRPVLSFHRSPRNTDTASAIERYLLLQYEVRPLRQLDDAPECSVISRERRMPWTMH